MSLFDRGRIIYAVPGHDYHQPLFFIGSYHAQLLHRRGPIDQFDLGEVMSQFFVAHSVDLISAQLQTGSQHIQFTGDRHCGLLLVAGYHDYFDACLPAFSQRPSYFRTGRVQHTGQSCKDQVVEQGSGICGIIFQHFIGGGNHPQGPGSHIFAHGQYLIAPSEGQLLCLPGSVFMGTMFQHLIGSSFDKKHSLAGVVPQHYPHQPGIGLEGHFDFPGHHLFQPRPVNTCFSGQYQQGGFSRVPQHLPFFFLLMIAYTGIIA